MPHPNISANTASRLAQAGALAYIIWALLHVNAAWSIYELGQSMTEGMPRGRVLQDAWNLFWLSVIALIVAIVLNWRNDVRGWWINLLIISVVDLGFLFYVLLPGYVPMWPGLAGPLFWILGLGLSSLGLHRATRPA
jgi:hypothetical protein